MLIIKSGLSSKASIKHAGSDVSTPEQVGGPDNGQVASMHVGL